MSAPLVRREMRRPGRSALVALTVTVAVAFTTAAFGFSEQLSRVLTPSGADPTAPTLPGGSIVVTADVASTTTVTALDDHLLDTIRAVPGVVSAVGSYDQPVSFLVSRSVQPDLPPLVRGLVFSSVDDRAVWSVVAGRGPTAPNEVALDRGGLAASGTFLGASARLQVPIGTIDVDVVGIVEPVTPPASEAAAGSDAPSAIAAALASAHVVLDPGTAPQLLDAVGKVDRITILPAPATNADELADRVRAVVAPGLRVSVIDERRAVTQQTIASIDSGLDTATLAYAALTVLIASFVVTNLLSVLVAQRTRELALLRLLGGSRRQIVRLVMGHAVLLGAGAAVVGGIVGAGLAVVALRIVATGDAPVSVIVTPAMAIVAAAVGVGVTVIGSIWPARRASTVTPIEAMSDTSAGADRPTRARRPLLMLVVAGVLAAPAALLTQLPTPVRLATGAGAAITALVGIALLSRWIVVPLSTVVSRPLVSLIGSPARLGIGNARRQPSRTAGAASTLMIGLVLVAATATIGASAKQAIDRQTRNAGRADLYLERRGLVRVSPGALGRRLSEGAFGVTNYAEAVRVDGALVGPDGSERNVVASGLERATTVMELGVVERDASVDLRSGVLVSQATARRLGVSPGSDITLQTLGGQRASLRVAATYTNTALFGPAIVAAEAANASGAAGTFEFLALDLRDDVPRDRIIRRINAIAEDFPKVAVNTPEQFGELQTSIADGVIRVISILLSGGLGIGFLGLAGTLALSVIERRRELVMLRAVGAARHQVATMVRVEAAFIGTVAAVLGVGVGATAGAAGNGLAPDSIAGPAVVPWAQLAVVSLAAVLASWIVAAGAAARSARVPPAEAGTA